MYVNLPEMSRETQKGFDNAFAKVRKAKGLILDVRHNDGGDSRYGNNIIGLLIKKAVKGSRWKTREYVPAFRAWGQPERWLEEEPNLIQPPGTNFYLGPVAVLTGPATFSAAEDFVVVLHASKRATIVGERTTGSTGQPLMIPLPGDAMARVCTKRDLYPDGREFVGIGIIPDVEIHPSAADIAADRDVVLEKAVEMLRKQSGDTQ